MILIAIILSLQNKILIITTLAWIALSFLYNKKSRKILFADSIILSITHSLLPILSTAFILGIFHKTFPIAVFVFLSMNLIIPMKNLNGIQEDLKRKYKTLPTKFQNGRTITIFLFNLYSILIILSLFLFNLNPNILILFSIIFLFHLLVNYLLKTKQDYLAYTIARFIVILFNLTIILSISTNKIILLGISLIAITYSAYLIKEVKNKWNTMM
ncbi:UbiA family prenyltransferase [archaeon]|nr:UbiA family prenyltransferase [archaeon]